MLPVDWNSVDRAILLETVDEIGIVDPFLGKDYPCSGAVSEPVRRLFEFHL